MRALVSTRRFVVALGVPIALVALASTSCSGPSKGTLERKVGIAAAPGSFRTNGVSTVFEKHCGSLDCHGSNARNMRIYSQYGLRLSGGDGGTITPGTAATTLDETTANYHSVLTVEPEQTNLVVDSQADPETLLILKKPLGIEHHKGGSTLRKGDDAEKCISTWLQESTLNPIDKTACTNAALFPKEDL
jgi:hypothetical protein